MALIVVGYAIQTEEKKFVYHEMVPELDGDCFATISDRLLYSRYSRCFWHIKDNAEKYAESLNGQFGKLTVVPLTISET